VLVACPVTAMDAVTFRAQYLEAAKQLEDAYSHCQVHTTTLTTNDKDDKWFTTTFRFMFSGENVRCEHEFEDAAEKYGRTIAGTPAVNFMILSKNDKQPVLEQVDRSSLGYHQAQQRVGSRADTALKAFTLFGTRITERLQSSHFTILKVEEIGDLIKVHFQNDEDTVSHRGWFAVLPKRNWVLDSWEAVLSKPGQDYSWRKDGKANYTDGQPVPHLAGIESHSYHADRTDTESTTVDLLKFEASPESEFMLSRYGYDDRLGTSTNFFWSLPFLLIVCGACCLLAVAGIRYRKRLS